MKLIYIILLSLLSFTVYSQGYNKVDTIWTLTYNDVTKLRDTIETVNKSIINLKEEIKLLDSISTTKDYKIKELEILISLQISQIEKYEELTEIYRDKLVTSNNIMNSYKLELVFSKDKLEIEKKNTSKEKTWKQIYKWGYPILIIVTGILILK